LIVFDHRGIICLTNDFARDMIGKSETQLIGSSVLELPGAKDLIAPLMHRLRREGIRDQEIPFMHPTLGKRVLSLSITVIPDAVGQPMAYVCVASDITERKRMEETVRRQEDRFRLLVEGIKDYAIILLDPTGKVASWNEGAQRIAGYTHDEIIGKHFSCFYPSEDIYRGRPDNELETAVKAGRFEEEGWRVRKDGSRFWANVTVTPLYNKDGRLEGFAKITRDVTEKLEAEEAVRLSERRFRRLFNSNIIGFLRVTFQGTILDINDALLKMLGYTRQDLDSGRFDGKALTPPEYQSADDWMRKRLRDEGVCYPIEKEYIRQDGTRVPVLVGAVRLEADRDECLCFVIDSSERRAAQEALRKSFDELEIRVQERTAELQHEIERRREAEQALRNMAVTDPLTGLFNRRGFLGLASDQLKIAERENRRLWIYFADLDNLKPINDHYGHSEGDHAITQAGLILRSTFRSSDIVARIGGDEFAVAAVMDNEEEAKAPLTVLQQKLTQYNSESGRAYTLSVSIGSASSEGLSSPTISQIMARADQELYAKKEARHASERNLIS
jgi:diguanylate cyclase (GGDEF)-like protein/PAS domain S-box-containing protein